MRSPVTRETPIFVCAIKLLVVALALFGQLGGAVAAPGGGFAQAKAQAQAQGQGQAQAGIDSVTASAIFCQGAGHATHHTPPPAPVTASDPCKLPAVGTAAPPILGAGPAVPVSGIAFTAPSRAAPRGAVLAAAVANAAQPRGPPTVPPDAGDAAGGSGDFAL